MPDPEILAEHIAELRGQIDRLTVQKARAHAAAAAKERRLRDALYDARTRFTNLATISDGASVAYVRQMASAGAEATSRVLAATASPLRVPVTRPRPPTGAEGATD